MSAVTKIVNNTLGYEVSISAFYHTTCIDDVNKYCELRYHIVGIYTRKKKENLRQMYKIMEYDDEVCMYLLFSNC